MLREIHLGMHGPDVLAVQQILNGANVFKQDFSAGAVDGLCGPRTCQAFLNAKWFRGDSKSDDTWGPFYGQALDDFLHGKVKRTKGQLATHLIRTGHKSPAPSPAVIEAQARAEVVKFAYWGLAHQPDIHYAERRPIPQVKQGVFPALPFTTDCSGFVTMAHQFAGLPDPNGQNYDGQGYTGTLLSHGQAIPLGQVKPGDAIVYGPYPGWHTAIVVRGGSDPLTISHGHESAPDLVHVSGDGRHPQTYLKLRLSDLAQ